MNTTALQPGETPPYGTEVAPRLNAPDPPALLQRPARHGRGRPEQLGLRGQHRRPPAGARTTRTATPSTPRSTLLTRESEAQRDRPTAAAARFWQIVNPAKQESPGPAGRLPSHARRERRCRSRTRRRRAASGPASWRKHLWVTPYHADGALPAGDYPNQNPGGDGLPQWTAADRSIADTDVVVWYTFGAHSHPAARGLAGDAGLPDRLHPQARRLLRAQPGAWMSPSPSKTSCCH